MKGSGFDARSADGEGFGSPRQSSTGNSDFPVSEQPMSATREGDWSSSQDYVRAVLQTYLSLPDTPRRPRPDDRYLALELYRQRIPLWQVECALLLACARRHFRHPEDPPLAHIRSLRYFRWVLEEVRQEGIDAAYRDYLRKMLSDVLVQKEQPYHKPEKELNVQRNP